MGQPALSFKQNGVSHLHGRSLYYSETAILSCWWSYWVSTIYHVEYIYSIILNRKLKIEYMFNYIEQEMKKRMYLITSTALLRFHIFNIIATITRQHTVATFTSLRLLGTIQKCQFKWIEEYMNICSDRIVDHVLCVFVSCHQLAESQPRCFLKFVLYLEALIDHLF